MILGTVLLLAGVLAAPGIGIYRLPLAAPATGTYFDHTVIIVMENQGIQDICNGNPPPCSGSANPFIDQLANNYTIAQQYTSIATPLSSAPNYVGLVAGSYFNCGGGGCPGGPLTQSNIVDSLESAGFTWKAYFENYPLSSGCAGFIAQPNIYNWLHNPFTQFNDIISSSARCANIVSANPSSCAIGAAGYATDCQLVQDLNSANAPRLAWLTPNECDDMHANTLCSNGCTVGGSTVCQAQGDAYLKQLVPQILSSAAFTTGRGALFITFDEGNGYCPSISSSSKDCVPAIWAGPQAGKKFFSASPFNHYSWIKTLETNWGLASLNRNDTAASSMTSFLVTGPPPPPKLSGTFSYSPLQPLIGDPVTFSAFASGGTPPYFYLWGFGDGSSSGTVTSTTITHTYTAAGTFTVSLFLTDSVAGDQASVSSPIVVVVPVTSLQANPPAFSPISPQFGQSVTFSETVSGGVPPYSVSWSFGDGTTGTGSTIVHAFVQGGVYTVTAAITDSANPPNSAAAQSTVTVAGPTTGPLAASFTWSPGVPITQQLVTFSAAVSGGTAPYTYSWIWGDGSPAVNNGGNPITHTFGAAGRYNVTLTVADVAAHQTSIVSTVTIQQGSAGGGPGFAIQLWEILTGAGAAIMVGTFISGYRVRRAG